MGVIARSSHWQLHVFSCVAVAAFLGFGPLHHVSAKATPFVEQSFSFDWNGDESVPIPTTAQCETLHITWSRDGVNEQINPNAPDPVSPYFLQVYTSLSLIPFVVNAGTGLSFDWAVPFIPGTLYQICMFDSNGASGGCQATYTVYPAPNSTVDNPPTCSNTTFPSSLNVSAQTTTGPLGQYSWVPQCTDISVKPTAGSPPFTLTIAPALHPIYNVTSNSMDAINWTVSLGYGMPFFLSLVDSQGTAWATGPLHSGGNGPTACLDTDAPETTQSSSHDVKPAVAVGAGIGGLFGGLAIGILGSYFLFKRRRRHFTPGVRAMEKDPDVSLVPQASLREPYQDLPSASGSEFSRTTRHSRNASYQIDPYPLTPSSTNDQVHDSLTAGVEAPLLGHESSRPPSTANDMLHSSYSASTIPSFAHRAMSPTPLTPGSQTSTDRAVYVVHHDGGRAPVTVYTSDGAEVVELPPEYSADQEGRRVVSESTALSPTRRRLRSISKPSRQTVS